MKLVYIIYAVVFLSSIVIMTGASMLYKDLDKATRTEEGNYVYVSKETEINFIRGSSILLLLLLLAEFLRKWVGILVKPKAMDLDVAAFTFGHMFIQFFVIIGLLILVMNSKTDGDKYILTMSQAGYNYIRLICILTIMLVGIEIVRILFWGAQLMIDGPEKTD